MRLLERVAIITGGGRGIGRAIALGYAREGAHVVVVARNVLEIQKVAAEVRAMGHRSLAIPADISDESQVEHMVRETLREFGTIDILVNNAGVARCAPVVEMKTEDWDLVLDVNLRGAFLCCRAVLPTMLANRQGWIINVSSDSGKKGWPEGSAYCASKFGLIGFSESLALEVMDRGINVNCLCPGPVVTSMSRQGRTEGDMREWMQPEDIVGAAIFLASDEARNVIGAALDVFGRVRP